MTDLAALGQVEHVANMARFLASDESPYCTGAEFVVDGGMTAA
jgi:3alpha(or 20beta)-hydroxysteroid dehydrogenase